MKIQKIALDDARYPSLLKEIYDPPKVLYAWGNSAILERTLCAIVGTRRASSYGEAQAFRFAKELSERGVCIVSGLAFGIDKAAHLGALEGEGGTIAVVAQSIEELEPSGHRGLADRIVAKDGLILSERCEGPYFKSDYLVRNRIIAGLCKATLVVEAPLKSGARNTAKQALDANREVFAIPGRISDEMSMGTNGLIHEGRAALTMNPAELAGSLEVEWKERKIVLDGLQRDVFQELERGPRSPAELGERFSALAELYNALSELELKGLIRFTRELRYAVAAGGAGGSAGRGLGSSSSI